MNTNPTLFDLDDLPKLSKQIIEYAKNQKLIAFYGGMGVGKTTLITSLCKALGVKDNVGSPTFSLVNQYIDKEGDPIYHFDFYRMKKTEEIYDIGYEEYFYSGFYCFMEWPELIEELLPEDCIKVYLTEEEGKRFYKIE